jgi:Skp family chaperone for outer membrane proteins
MEESLRDRLRELDGREGEIETKEARLEADIDIREDKLERREQELVALQERLGQKETELAAYVAQVQTQLKQREDEWWQKVTGGDPDPVPVD